MKYSIIVALLAASLVTKADAIQVQEVAEAEANTELTENVFDEDNVLVDAEEEDSDEDLEDSDDEDDDAELDDEEDKKVENHKNTKIPIKKSGKKCKKGSHAVFKNLGSKKTILGGKNKGKALPEWAIVC